MALISCHQLQFSIQIELKVLENFTKVVIRTQLIMFQDWNQLMLHLCSSEFIYQNISERFGGFQRTELSVWPRGWRFAFSASLQAVPYKEAALFFISGLPLCTPILFKVDKKIPAIQNSWIKHKYHRDLYHKLLNELCLSFEHYKLHTPSQNLRRCFTLNRFQ